MTTFNLAEVHDFTAGIGTRMERCLHGEGAEWATLDDALKNYARLCREFIDGVRQWKDAIFHGRAEFDPQVEVLLKEEGRRLHSGALDRYTHGRQSEVSSSPSENLDALAAALRDLERLLAFWVTPKIAVGPSATRWKYPHQAATEEEIRQVATLPPLPADWEPIDPDQRERFRKLRKS
jgi:hypothetical protein